MVVTNPRLGDGDGDPGGEPTRRAELFTFILATFVLIPGASVAFVGAYGFVIWIMQMIFGPPGPPG